MAIPSEVRKTIHAIDRKIRDLEDTKQRLLETFGGSLPAAKSNGSRPQTVPSTAETNSTIPMSSKERLDKYLRENGPVTRKEIVEKSGVPDGSISYLLKNGKFRQRDDERWEAVDGR